MQIGGPRAGEWREAGRVVRKYPEPSHCEGAAPGESRTRSDGDAPGCQMCLPVWRNVYIELPRQHEKHGDGSIMGKRWKAKFQNERVATSRGESRWSSTWTTLCE